MVSCNNNKTPDQPSPAPDSSITQSQPTATEQLSTLPSFVIYRNWEPGNPENSHLVLKAYKAWDSDSTGVLASFFADTTRFDLPDARRFTMTNKSIEPTLRKWRKNYKETSNIPFSLISLHNKDLDQQWVIAWTWNKWSLADGSKDFAGGFLPLQRLGKLALQPGRFFASADARRTLSRCRSPAFLGCLARRVLALGHPAVQPQNGSNNGVSLPKGGTDVQPENCRGTRPRGSPRGRPG